MGDLLKHGHDIISEGMVTNRSDGMVRPEDAEWGRYLLTLNQDHLELVGFNPRYSPKHIYNLIVDNLRLREVLKEGASEEGSAA